MNRELLFIGNSRCYYGVYLVELLCFFQRRKAVPSETNTSRLSNAKGVESPVGGMGALTLNVVLALPSREMIAKVCLQVLRVCSPNKNHERILPSHMTRANNRI